MKQKRQNDSYDRRSENHPDNYRPHSFSAAPGIIQLRAEHPHYKQQGKNAKWCAFKESRYGLLRRESRSNMIIKAAPRAEIAAPVTPLGKGKSNRSKHANQRDKAYERIKHADCQKTQKNPEQLALYISRHCKNHPFDLSLPLEGAYRIYRKPFPPVKKSRSF